MSKTMIYIHIYCPKNLDLFSLSGTNLDSATVQYRKDKACQLNKVSTCRSYYIQLALVVDFVSMVTPPPPPANVSFNSCCTPHAVGVILVLQIFEDIIIYHFIQLMCLHMTEPKKSALYLVVLIIYNSSHLPHLPTNYAFNGNGIMHHTLSKNIVHSNLLKAIEHIDEII